MDGVDPDFAAVRWPPLTVSPDLTWPVLSYAEGGLGSFLRLVPRRERLSTRQARAHKGRGGSREDSFRSRCRLILAERRHRDKVESLTLSSLRSPQPPTVKAQRRLTLKHF
jgi:hypothetical protein